MQTIELGMPSTSNASSVSSRVNPSKVTANFDDSAIEEQDPYFTVTRKLHALADVVDAQQREIENQKKDIHSKTKCIEELKLLLGNTKTPTEIELVLNNYASVSPSLPTPSVPSASVSDNGLQAPKLMHPNSVGSGGMGSLYSFPNGASSALSDVSASLNFPRKPELPSRKSTSSASFSLPVKGLSNENFSSASSTSDTLESSKAIDRKAKLTSTPWDLCNNNHSDLSLANIQLDGSKSTIANNSLSNSSKHGMQKSVFSAGTDVSGADQTAYMRDLWPNETNASMASATLGSNLVSALKAPSLSSSRSSSYTKGPSSSIWDPSSNVSLSNLTDCPNPRENAIRYRKLSERNAVYDWNIIVNKIILSNDQQSSIFLQQKLKVASPEIKQSIINCILIQAFPLMLNRFGNFLIQRCFEHGTPHQIRIIGSAILGNMYKLATDPFGCHVVQKAFDNIDEDIKYSMMEELFVTIDETIMHHYACHVWQKLFETRWFNYPVNVMDRVNIALKGKWHEVALGENGSLVVQNMFENCVEKDKHDCVEEVILHLDLIVRGQWGNWVIQHMVENSQGDVLRRVVAALLLRATEYSVDQYASKVMEKAIKFGPRDFISLYLKQITNARMDRTRQPLIDIASDQYGNYLIQQIIQLAQPSDRSTVVTHIKKHMVSLRGSKYGQKVAFLAEKWKTQNPQFVSNVDFD
ncbi:RNA-binding protein Mcp2 [Schizosaccharomyces cryophilus OY26]|uniref:RNA-binding protein Mcp2 n=1 Tax=Schizosaccharomyces cryophilus (strain OY26 / ATCC MYA-4695 / CBS 11777 / NBRC 106824 / NRRL Y48691) TaxID=653667 RepID=S9VV75_SCHCR|nr:RNA-binding protein Mcp2 [Schizosaccharomyces cryophilus OY26]EPY49975.1 RNA-binding protein Mcp2 [Schizosaccharomyces cryophilus OY26]